MTIDDKDPAVQKFFASVDALAREVIDVVNKSGLHPVVGLHAVSAAMCSMTEQLYTDQNETASAVEVMNNVTNVFTALQQGKTSTDVVH